MQRAACVVAACFGKRQSFHNHALAGKGRVAVHEQRQHMLALWVVTAVHTGAHRANNYGVDDFKVRRVGCQAQMHWRAVRSSNVGAKALMVFHITAGQVFGGCMLEFGKQFLRHFAQQIDQHIEPATVRHADDDFLQAAFASFAHHFIHGYDKALSTFERKTLLPDVFGV